MSCESCAKMIEIDLEDVNVTKALCNFAKAELEATFDPNTVSEEKIIQTVQKNGYKLTEK